MARETKQLVNQLWGLVVAQGVVAVLFGLAALFWPGATLALLVVLFGIFVLVWGIVDLIGSVVSIGKVNTWWLELIFSLLTIGLGVFLLRNIEVGIGVFILLVGFTFVIRGIIDILTAFISKDLDIKETRPFYVITGVLGLLAGIIVLAHPVASGIAFVWVVGLYAVLQGSLLVAFALRVRSAHAK